MNAPNANDLIMGNTVAAARFDTVGTIVKGTIVNVDTAQQRDYKTRDLLFWSPDNKPTTVPSDRPMMQAILTVQTEDRDPGITDDDGVRRLYVGGRNIRDAVRDAVIRAGRKQIEVGGTIAVQYSAGKGGTEDPKQYVAEYAPPAVGVGLLTGNDQTTTTAPAGTAAAAGTSLLG